MASKINSSPTKKENYHFFCKIIFIFEVLRPIFKKSVSMYVKVKETYLRKKIQLG